MANTGTGSMVDVMRYFQMDTGTFRTEWKDLSDMDKTDLKNGVGKVSLNADKTPVTDASGNVVTSGTLTY